MRRRGGSNAKTWKKQITTGRRQRQESGRTLRDNSVKVGKNNYYLPLFTSNAEFGNPTLTQLNFSGPEFVFAKFCEVLRKYMAANFTLKVIWVRGLGKMAPDRARVSASGRVREGDAKLVR